MQESWLERKCSHAGYVPEIAGHAHDIRLAPIRLLKFLKCLRKALSSPHDSATITKLHSQGTAASHSAAHALYDMSQVHAHNP